MHGGACLRDQAFAINLEHIRGLLRDEVLLVKVGGGLLGLGLVASKLRKKA